MAIDDIRLDDRALGSDRTIQALVAATLLVAAIGVGWLVLAAAGDERGLRRGRHGTDLDLRGLLWRPRGLPPVGPPRRRRGARLEPGDPRRRHHRPRTPGLPLTREGPAGGRPPRALWSAGYGLDTLMKPAP